MMINGQTAQIQDWIESSALGKLRLGLSWKFSVPLQRKGLCLTSRISTFRLRTSHRRQPLWILKHISQSSPFTSGIVKYRAATS